MIAPTRRGLITGLGAILAAPAVVRAESLMPISPEWRELHFVRPSSGAIVTRTSNVRISINGIVRSGPVLVHPSDRVRVWHSSNPCALHYDYVDPWTRVDKARLIRTTYDPTAWSIRHTWLEERVVARPTSVDILSVPVYKYSV
jgi:hypothetical protein